MLRGIQTSISAMRAQIARQEVLERNLVNLAVPGFKQEGVAVDGFALTIHRVQKAIGGANTLPAAVGSAIGSIGTGTIIDRAYVDFRQGELQQTDRTLDLALEGDGFLQVRTPRGDVFTRGGALRLEADRRLVTAEGHAVLGTEGEVVLPEGDIHVGSDGTLSLDGEPVARLSVVEFLPGTRLAKFAPGLYSPDDPATPPPAAAASTVVRSGFLEASNVDETSTLSDMMSLLRAYQASQRMLQAQDDLLGKAVNEVGRV